MNPTAEHLNASAEILVTLLDLLGMKAKVQPEAEDEDVVLKVETDIPGRIIGRKGGTVIKSPPPLSWMWTAIAGTGKAAGNARAPTAGARTGRAVSRRRNRNRRARSKTQNRRRRTANAAATGATMIAAAMTAGAMTAGAIEAEIGTGEEGGDRDAAGTVEHAVAAGTRWTRVSSNSSRSIRPRKSSAGAIPRPSGP
jgi:hypothetical protein